MTRSLINDAAETTTFDNGGDASHHYHARLPGYAASSLVPAPGLAADLGLGAVWVKDESSRMGLPAFKILGASWATYRALEEVAGSPLEPWADVGELGEKVRASTPVRKLSAATDGNHGRAVARTASWLGLAASIYVPAGTTQARIDAIAGEGATVTVVEGTYDDAVAAAAREADESCLVIQDTSWEGYRDIPRWVIDGYSTIFSEARRQLFEAGEDYPDVVVVQIGVGALAASVVHNHRSAEGPRARILGVEPDTAACVLASLEAGEIVTVPGPHPSIMVGLNCGTPSDLAWPELSTGINAYVAVEDDAAREAMRRLADAGVVSGETGAAGLAGLMAALEDEELRRALDLNKQTRVLLISTEGDTDPGAYEAIVGRPASAVAQKEGGRS